MADEIVKMGQVVEPKGFRCSFLYLFPIVPPIRVDNENVAPTPSQTLPEMDDGRSAAVLLTTGELAQLDIGTLMFTTDSFFIKQGGDGDEASRRHYAARDPKVVLEQRDKYDDRHTGDRLDAYPEGRP